MARASRFAKHRPPESRLTLVLARAVRLRFRATPSPIKRRASGPATHGSRRRLVAIPVPWVCRAQRLRKCRSGSQEFPLLDHSAPRPRPGVGRPQPPRGHRATSGFPAFGGEWTRSRRPGSCSARAAQPSTWDSIDAVREVAPGTYHIRVQLHPDRSRPSREYALAVWSTSTCATWASDSGRSLPRPSSRTPSRAGSR